MQLEQFLQKIKSYAPESRIWIYQADRILQDNEVAVAEEILLDFTQKWAAHGKPLNATASIVFNTFLILIVDEAAEKASGCSIDTSVKIVKELGAQLGVDFFNRFAIAYISGDMFDCVSKEDFQKLIDSGKKDLLVFNNTLTQLSQLEEHWILPFENSWHANYFTSSNSFSFSL